MIYAFDLDSTLTKEETLPYLAKNLNLGGAYERAAKETQLLPYEDALKLRLKIFKDVPSEKISALLAKIPVFPKLQEFIRANAENSCIITSNLSEYAQNLAAAYGCKLYGSRLEGENIRIINKEEIVLKLKKKDKVCFTGDGANDAAALKAADFSIAASYARKAAKEAVKAAQREAETEEELLFLLARVGF